MKVIIQQKMKVLSKHPLSIILLLYTVANLFMLLNNGWYWDDWCLSSPEGIKDICAGAGIPFMTPIHSWLINSTAYPALLYHIITGIMELLGIVLFYKCLLMINVSHSHTFLMTLVFAVLPYNQAKITMACFMYTIGFLFFLLAVYLFINFTRNNNFILRIISLILFFGSFMFLPSTLVLALAFLLFMAIIGQKQEIEFKLSYFKLILPRLINWADFILLPFIFWIFRALYLKPTGIYATEGYREFSLNSVLLTPINLIVAFIQNFIGLGAMNNPSNIAVIYTLLFFAVCVVMFIVLGKYKIDQQFNSKRMLYIGLYFFIAGAFAYTMLGLSPTFNGFNSRHQILLKFGSTFIIFYLVCLIRSERAQRLTISTIISLFIVYNISCQLQFQKSWFKQMALKHAFPLEKSLSEGVNFVIIDNTNEYNEFNGALAFYCYTGILKNAFGTQTRFAVDSKDQKAIAQYNPRDFINNSFYNMKDCKNIKSFNYWMIIDKGSLLLSNKQNLIMLYQYYFDKLKFGSSLNNIISLNILPYNVKNL